MLWLYLSFIQSHEAYYIPCWPFLLKKTPFLLLWCVSEPINWSKLFIASLKFLLLCPSSPPLLASESKDRSLAFVVNIWMKCSDKYTYVCTQKRESPFFMGSVLFSLCFTVAHLHWKFISRKYQSPWLIYSKYLSPWLRILFLQL